MSTEKYLKNILVYGYVCGRELSVSEVRMCCILHDLKPLHVHLQLHAQSLKQHLLHLVPLGISKQLPSSCPLITSS